jgi:hypothetical protein
MTSSTRDSPTGESKERKEESLLAEQKVTFLACLQGGIASIGGFIFGYIRSVF